MSDPTAVIEELSPKQRELLLLRLRRESREQVKPVTIKRASKVGEPLPLSFAQLRLWFLDQLDPGSASYNIPQAVRLMGPLDISALERVVREIARRHDILRTTFTVVDDQPVQIIAPAESASVDVPPHDLSELPEEERYAAVKHLTRQSAQHAFDLTRGPLWRIVVLRLGAEEHVVLLTMHHIVSDGWSMNILLREMTTLYEACVQGRPLPLPELPIQYADYAMWQREWLVGEVLEKELVYWREQLGGAPAVLELPTDRPRPPMQTFHGARRLVPISTEVIDPLKSFSQREGATLFMTLLAGFKALLYRYSGQQDVVVGTPIAGRKREETEPLIGFFANTLALRTKIDPRETFRGFLGQIREVCLGAYAHQDLPFEKLVEELQPERNLSHSPLFQVMFALENMDTANLDADHPGSLWLSGMEANSGTSKLDLTLSLIEVKNWSGSALEYKTDLFDDSTIERMAEHFLTLLGGIGANPNQPIHSLPLLSPTELHQILHAWNMTARPFPHVSSLHQLFSLQAARTPQTTALTSHDQSLTYAELEARANQVARFLRRRGVGAETLVGLCFKRSAEMVVWLLGIVKAGGAYVPLDPGYPGERLRYMVEDAGVKAVVVGGDERGMFEGMVGVEVVDIEEARGEVGGESEASLEEEGVGSESVVYVIYTSGSTGRPKGVMVSHRNLMNFLMAMQEQPGLAASDVLLAVTSLSFDIAGLELFLPLSVGAQVVIAGRETATDAALLVRALRETKASVMQATPATWRMLLDGAWVGDRGLKILCGGEALSRDLAGRLVERGADVWNLYGPTETTIWSCALRLSGEKPQVTLGRPIANTQIYILDNYLRPVPIGVTGELFIGGEGVAPGYLNRPSLTAERFLPDPYVTQPGQRTYRTGDRARFHPDGSIEFLGRLDQQLKIRGFRIEPGEIEAVLEEHPHIEQAVVIARPDRHGELQLVAYVVWRRRGEGSVRELRGYAQERLPEHLRPGAYVELEAMPLTPNGKVDRGRLPEVMKEVGDGARELAPARTLTEEILVGIWREVLRVERVGVHDNFFELGGHSLLATQVMSRVRKAFGREIRLSALFESPTIAGLSETIERELRASDGLQTQPIKSVPRESELPLSYAQQRQWFLDQMEPGTGAYNIPEAVRLHGALDLNALERAVTEVVRRHEVLRTVFAVSVDRPAQIIKPPFEVKVPVTGISHLGEEEREKEAFRLTTEEARRPFDLANGPLLRVGLIRLGTDEYIVLLTAHHIAADGWSMGVLVNELVTLYDAFTNGRPSPLPDLTIQYADYAAWQQSWLQGAVLERQLDYWKRQLDGAPALELPTDRPRPPVQSFRGGRAMVRLSPELSSAIQTLARREGATLFMTLLSAWQVLLSRYSDQEDISVGSFIANRNRAETESLIGFFINNLVFRTDLSGNPTFRELLGRTRRVALEAYMRQDAPFEMVLEALRPERDASRTSLFQVMFVMQNMPQGEVQAAQARFSPVEASDPGRSNFDLTLWMWEGPVGLAGWLDYSTDLFELSTIERLIEHFVLLLEGIVADPDGRLRQLPLLSGAERQQLLVGWNANKQDYPAEVFVQQLFEAQAARQPKAEAVIFEGTRLTYGELNARANQLAHYLRANGVGPETRVGICVERSVEMVLGALGVLKAGAAYVPLDPAYPGERLLFMMEDSQASWLLTQQRLIQSLPAATVQQLGARADHVRVLRLDADVEALAGESVENPICNVAPENLAYVIYTSGSTQRPRGVMIQHGSLVNAFYAWEKAYSLSAQIKSQLQVASFAFDVFSGDLTRVLCTGARLVIAPGELLLSAPELYELMRREAVEGVEIVPAVLRNLVGHLEETGQSLDFMRLIVAGADAFYVKEMEQARQLCGPKTRLFNSYGLTEATIDSAYFEKTEISLPPEKMAPIGRPFANTEIYILDRNLQPVPVGVAGELHVGGPALARGYLNQTALTAAKFTPHPFSQQPGARLYKTGDLARYLPDGNLEFMRRLDYQVKVRGFRIELEEIESVLTSHEGVREALVVAHESAPGEKHLVAYIVPSQPAPPSVQELQQLIREHLPAYMLPAAFFMLEAFPLSPNGKIDRKALPAPDPEMLAPTNTYVEPGTPLEEMLVGIWEEVLGRKRIGVFDNFFEIGGHSLLATQIVARVRKNLDVELPLRSLFETPTIAEVAVTIEEMMLQEIDDTGDDGSSPAHIS